MEISDIGAWYKVTHYFHYFKSHEIVILEGALARVLKSKVQKSGMPFLTFHSK